MTRARSRAQHAAARTALHFLLPAEERWGSSAGGAVATWVREVRRLLPFASTVWSADTAAGPRWHRDLNSWLRRASDVAARLTGRSADTIHLRAILGGRMWVWAVAPMLVGAPLIHVHNRPSYVAWLRRLGIDEPIVLHAHNDLVGAAEAAARRSAARQTAAEIVASADHIVFCSQYLRDQAEAVFGPLPASVIHNGVSIRQTAVSDVPAHPHSAIWAGRLVPEKGAAEALAVISALADTPWTLTLCGGSAGRGRSAYAREVAAAAAASDRAHMAGFLPHHSLLKEYSRHAVFLFPCQWPEPFGMVLIEAMAAGAVVVAPRTGGIPEIIDDGRTGILLPPDATPEQYAQVLRTLEPARLATIRQAARAEVCKRFGWETAAAELTQLFESRGWLPRQATAPEAEGSIR